jgi:hypothetical protein
MFAATVSGVVLGSLAAVGVIARGEVAESGTMDRGAWAGVPPAAHARSAGSVRAQIPAQVPMVDAGVADAVDPVDPVRAPDAHTGEAAPPKPPALRVARDRVTRTGELAIIVRPWAMIWLNGKPSGQTPFRAAVPAGRYRVRLANDDVGRDEIALITVEPDQTATIERTW